eukprot:1154607-Pelagomonas_calceolata.AAC.5
MVPHPGSLFPHPCSGDEAQSKRGILSLSYPIAHGIVTNWWVLLAGGVAPAAVKELSPLERKRCASDDSWAVLECPLIGAQHRHIIVFKDLHKRKAWRPAHRSTGQQAQRALIYCTCTVLMSNANSSPSSALQTHSQPHVAEGRRWRLSGAIRLTMSCEWTSAHGQ